MSKNVLIYLHGFNSSPQSTKAQLVTKFVSQHYPAVELVMPQLLNSPLATWQQIDKLVKRYQGQHIAFIGSSLGGFYATLMANGLGAKAVLINPAVKPHLLMELLLGEQLNPYTGQRYVITADHQEQLRKLDLKQLKQSENYWLLLQQADETLDYRDALRFYNGARITLEPMGDHGFAGFERYLNAIVEYLFRK